MTDTPKKRRAPAVTDSDWRDIDNADVICTTCGAAHTTTVSAAVAWARHHAVGNGHVVAVRKSSTRTFWISRAELERIDP